VLLSKPGSAKLPSGEFAMAAREQYLVDPDGKRTGVLIGLDYYQRLVEALEEVEAIRAYDEAKASGDEAIPLAESIGQNCA
jgi:hypothetical protein